MRIIALILALLVSLPAYAEGALTTDLRAAMIADDPAQAETLISAAHQASLASHDTTAISLAYRRIFGSTDPARADFIDHWIGAYPKSAYAQTALAEQLYMTAFAYQQPGVTYPKDASAIQKRKHFFTLARNAAQRAMVLDRSFSRATDLWLFMVPFDADRAAVADLARKTLQAAPNRRSAIFAADAFTQYGTINDYLIFEICAELAPMVLDFTPDTCAIAAIFLHHSMEDITGFAANALDANDDADLAQARIESIVWHNRASRYTVDEAIAMQVGLLETTANLEQWLDNSQSLSRVYPDSYFAAEAIGMASNELTARLTDNRFNPSLIQMRLSFQDYYKAGTSNLPDLGPDDKMTLWQGGLHYGYLTEEYWRAGSRVVYDRDQSPMASMPYEENAVVVSGGSTFSLDMLIRTLAEIRGVSGREVTNPDDPKPEPDKDNFAVAECPLLRASRLFLATCVMDMNTQDFSCLDSSAAVMIAQVAVQQANAGDLCPALAATPLRELVYKDMVAVPGFTPPADGQ